MKTTTVTEFRSKMKAFKDNQDILIVTGPKKKDYVVLTLDQFNAMEETAHLMSTQANVTRLLESIAQDKTGHVTVKKLSLDNNTPPSPVRKKSTIKRKKQ